ncbi:amino acid adenylation domain-containing protein (plasmid) [Embleya sp. NBC_00888]|uniref:amino acid adenylation domain-containing protein n=1 Tax=Embleya sp. NBC_00888 TaxID=2975960 RepID=UPI002F9189FE|nr:amino acid adenylation domain-containing protein [Embleya sp. NBC_00888]
MDDERTLSRARIEPTGHPERIASTASARAPGRPHAAVLSFGQERLWFLDRFEPGDAAWNIPWVLRLTGPLRPDALRAAFDGVVARHDALRTRFPDDQGRPVAVIEPPGPVPIETVDLSGPGADRALDRVLATRVNAGFDLALAPPLRVTLIRLGATRHVLCVVLHHILADGWSLNLLRRELELRYSAYRDGVDPVFAPLPSYAEYAARQREADPNTDRAIDYWRRQLADLPALELPSDRPRTADTGSAADFHTRRVAGIGPLLDTVARARRCTPFMILLAGYQALLHRHGGQRDFAVGAPIAGRGDVEHEEPIGYFSNTLVLRADLRGEPTFGELLRRTRKTALGAYGHDRIPFEQLLAELRVDRDPAAPAPLFQTLLTVHTQDQDTGPAHRFADLTSTEEDGGHRAAKFDLSLDIRRAGDDLIAVFGYRTALFDASTVADLAERLEILLRGALADPDTPVHLLPLLTAADHARLRELRPHPAPAASSGAVEPTDTVPAAIARVPGDGIALRTPDGTVTYRELDRRVSTLATRLRRAGVRPGALVGVLCPRGPDAIVALLAAWHTGAAYLPMDPRYPAARLEFMLADSGTRVVITDGAHADGLPEGVSVVRMDTTAGQARADRAENASVPPTDTANTGTPADPVEHASVPVTHTADAERPADPVEITPEHPAYVIYTSGSTGTPKGVLVPHGALAARVRWMRRGYHIRADDRVLHSASLSFDTHAEELYPCLAAGATLVLPAPDATLPDVLAEGGANDVTVLDLPTPYWHELVETGADTIAWPAALRLLILGADQVRPGAVAAWRARFGDRVRLVNSYGPTETTIIATTADLGPADTDRRPPIGTPIGDTHLVVADPHGNPVPPGVPGELLIGGAGVAHGYLGRPAATAAGFGPDPDGPPGARRYRTGDRVRLRPDGQLEFLGRLDAQVKVRGHRVEPGEVEAALLARPGVVQAAVVAREQALVGYVVTTADLSVPELRADLAGRLPAHLVPDALVRLDRLPLTPNGKLDHRALPAPDRRADQAHGYLAPRTAAEELVAEIWIEVLGLDKAGALDDFFDLGGHSLLATRVVARIAATADLTVPLRTLFTHRTLAGFAAAVEDLLVADLEALDDDTAERLLTGERNRPQP